jgi:hypothetical protein
MGGGGNFHDLKKVEAVCSSSIWFLVRGDAVRPSGIGKCFPPKQKQME